MNRREKYVIVLTLLVIIVLLGSVALPRYNLSSYFQNEKSINIVVTSFNVNIIYGGEAKSYFEILSQTYRCAAPDSTTAYNCDTYSGPQDEAYAHYFLDSIVLQTVNNSAHTIGNISVITPGFKGQVAGALAFGSGGQTTFPLRGYAGGSFTIQVSYVGNRDYNGDVTVDIYSPA